MILLVLAQICAMIYKILEKECMLCLIEVDIIYRSFIFVAVYAVAPVVVPLARNCLRHGVAHHYCSTMYGLSLGQPVITTNRLGKRG